MGFIFFFITYSHPFPQSHASVLDLFMLNFCEAPSEELCDAEGEGQEPKIDGPTKGATVE